MTTPKFERKLTVSISGSDPITVIGEFSMSKSLDDCMGTGTLKMPYSDILWQIWTPGSAQVLIKGGLYDDDILFSGRTRSIKQEGDYIVVALQDEGWKLKKEYTGDFQDQSIIKVFNDLITEAGMNPILQGVKDEKVSLSDLTGGGGSGLCVTALKQAGCDSVPYRPAERHCWVNHCPCCGKDGTLIPSEKPGPDTYHMGVNCYLGKGGCDCDFCGKTGWELSGACNTRLTPSTGAATTTTTDTTETDTATESDGSTTTDSSSSESKTYEEVFKDLCADRDYIIVTDQKNNCYISEFTTPTIGTETIEDWMIERKSFNYDVAEFTMKNSVTVEYNGGSIKKSIPELIELFGEQEVPKISKPEMNATDAEKLAEATLEGEFRDEQIKVSCSVLSSYKWRPGMWANIKNPKTKKVQKLIISNISDNIKTSAIPLNNIELRYAPPKTQSTKYETGGSLGNIAGSLSTVCDVCNWVDTNITWIYYLDHRYDPDEVLRLRVGNCSDQSDLVIAMLAAKGIAATKVHTTCPGYGGHYNVAVNVGGRTIICDPSCSALTQCR